LDKVPKLQKFPKISEIVFSKFLIFEKLKNNRKIKTIEKIKNNRKIKKTIEKFKNNRKNQNQSKKSKTIEKFKNNRKIDFSKFQKFYFPNFNVFLNIFANFPADILFLIKKVENHNVEKNSQFLSRFCFFRLKYFKTAKFPKNIYLIEKF